MAMNSTPFQLNHLSNCPFSYDNDGLNVDGISRIGGPSLHEMLFPDQISGKRAQKRARDRAETTITFPWLIAQFTFYDIEFDPKDTVAELTEMLADNVKQGRCDKLPSRVRAIASELEQLFKATNSEHPKVRPKIDKPPQKIGTQKPVKLSLENKHKQTLEKFNTPVDLANHDCSLFLAKYFLDRDWKPDPSKSPFPILLPGLSDRLALQQAADTVPGLKTSSGGEGDLRVVVIGWIRAAIFEETERISAEQAILRDEMSPTWQERLQKHYSFINTLPVLSKPRKFAIESAQGNYAVECRGVMDNYSHDDDSSIRIIHSKIDGWVGVFKIGVIYGVMRLDTDRKALLARCKATEKNESRVDDHTGMDIALEELGTTEEDDDASGEEDVFSDLSADERDQGDEPKSHISASAVVREKRKSAPTRAPNPAAKRPKPSSSTSPNRLYFKWRGREKGQGEVAYDGYKKNTGYLQFTDSNFTKFESTISSDRIGKNVRFQGFKVSADGGGAATRTYRDYSERAGDVFDGY